MSLRAVRHPGELRWETRLLGVVTLTLLVFGLATTYSAQPDSEPRAVVGIAFALRQLLGACLGGALLLLASRVDYYRWRQLAWPLLLGTVVLLLIPTPAGDVRDRAAGQRGAALGRFRPHQLSAVGNRAAGRGDLVRDARHQEGRPGARVQARRAALHRGAWWSRS